MLYSIIYVYDSTAPLDKKLQCIFDSAVFSFKLELDGPVPFVLDI